MVQNPLQSCVHSGLCFLQGSQVSGLSRSLNLNSTKMNQLHSVLRLGTYSANASTIPPAATVASRAMAADPKAEPLFAERIPYVVS